MLMVCVILHFLLVSSNTGNAQSLFMVSAQGTLGNHRAALPAVC